MEKKICKICNVLKPIEEFNFYKEERGLRLNQCRGCKILYLRKYASDRKELRKIKGKQYREKNKEIVSERKKIYYLNNKEKIREYKKKWETDKRNNDILFRLKQQVRHRLGMFLKTNKMKKNNKTFNIIGCDPEFLKEHLENQFVSGMTWENRSEWHIDHIIPLSSAKNEEEIYKLCHYTNLQPLWAEDNLKKNNKIIDYSNFSPSEAIIK